MLELSDSCDCLPRDVLAGMAAELEAMFSPGDVVLWNWVEHLRERWTDVCPPRQQVPPHDRRETEAGADAALSAELQAVELLGGGGGPDLQQARQQERGGSGDAAAAELEAAMAEVAGSVMHGEPFTEKRSTFQVPCSLACGACEHSLPRVAKCEGFKHQAGWSVSVLAWAVVPLEPVPSLPTLQAHLAPVRTMRQVEALMELLLQNNKVRAATHNIMAYRIELPERGTFLQVCAATAGGLPALMLAPGAP